MASPDSDLETGWIVLVAIPLIGNGLLLAVGGLLAPFSFLSAFSMIFGLWMLLVAHLLLLAGPIWRYAAAITYAWLALNSIVAVAQGVASRLLLIWTAICVASMTYLMVRIWRARRAHAI
jgi:hypothetical protein